MYRPGLRCSDAPVSGHCAGQHGERCLLQGLVKDQIGHVLRSDDHVSPSNIRQTATKTPRKTPRKGWKTGPSPDIYGSLSNFFPI